MNLSIDFFLRILALSFFHPSFALIYLPFMSIQGYGFYDPVFLWSGLYTFLVCFFWGLGYVSKKSRNGWEWRPQQLNWEDEIVVITGGSRGIGGLLAESLAIRNVTVVVLDLVPPEMEHANIEYYECDVSKLEEVKRVAKDIVEELGHPTILVNNAGVVKGKNILEESEEEILSTISVNLLASFWTTKVFLPEMVKNNHGHIVTVASAIGYSSIPQAADYCASKSGLIGFHEALRYELLTRYNAKKVRASLICPGEVQTGLFKGVTVRFPFITPPLTPLEVVKKIITALDKNEGQDILMPYYVNLIPLLRFLPGFVNDMVHKFTGANDGMRTWVDTRGSSTSAKKNL